MSLDDDDLKGIVRKWLKDTFKNQEGIKKTKIGSSHHHNKWTIKNQNTRIMATYFPDRQKMVLFGLTNLSSWQTGEINLADPSFFEKLEKHIRDNFRK